MEIRNTNGRFVKGHKGLKPKGSKHKSTELRMQLDEIISSEMDNLPALLASIERPEVRAKLLIDLLPYKIPKLQSVEFSQVLEKQIENLSDEDLNRLLDAVTEKINEHEQG